MPRGRGLCDYTYSQFGEGKRVLRGGGGGGDGNSVKTPRHSTFAAVILRHIGTVDGEGRGGRGGGTTRPACGKLSAAGLPVVAL